MKIIFTHLLWAFEQNLLERAKSQHLWKSIQPKLSEPLVKSSALSAPAGLHLIDDLIGTYDMSIFVHLFSISDAGCIINLLKSVFHQLPVTLANNSEAVKHLLVSLITHAEFSVLQHLLLKEQVAFLRNKCVASDHLNHFESSIEARICCVWTSLMQRRACCRAKTNSNLVWQRDDLKIILKVNSDIPLKP